MIELNTISYKEKKSLTMDYLLMMVCVHTKNNLAGDGMLKRCLTDCAEFADTMACTRNNIQILQFILDVGNVSEDVKNEYFGQFISEVIAKPNEQELAVYNTIEYNEILISCYGNKEKEEQIYTRRQGYKKKELNLIMEMIDWICDMGSKERPNGQIRLNMFTLTGWLQKKTVQQYTDHYRLRFRTVNPAAQEQISL